MKIIVTGVAGFIGSAVAKRLKELGHEVVGIDNFNDYYDVSLKRMRVKSLLRDIPIYEIDITHKDALLELFEKNKPDMVCHLAAQAGVRYSVECPEVYVETNVSGTQTVLEVMKVTGVTRMVYASTSSVYGTSTKSPFAEDVSADRPVSVYAATKRAGELLAHSYFSLYGIETTCLRFFTVYGPWSRPDMAMLKFANKISAGEKIEIYNHGDLRRDFTNIDDIVNGFVLAVEKPLGFEILNLGNGNPVALMDMVTSLEKNLGQEAIKEYVPMQPGDVYETYADVSKAERLLGFKAKKDFETGVSEFVDWYRAYSK